MDISLSPFPCKASANPTIRKGNPKKTAHFISWEKKVDISIIKKPEKQRDSNLSQSHPQEIKAVGSTLDPSLFLLGELFCTNVATTELDVEHALHRTENFLVRCRSAPLEVLNDSDGSVALGGQLLLRHLVAFFGATLLDRIAHGVTNGFGLDDVVAAVDLCQVLAFGGACFRGL